ncbi:4Fe-4S cluster-binding domain-containing protein [Actinomadura sp. LD22]|uniref:4Fe-4S cluster-binding domain-containing protein n=1 Tax=Actinomadura physcomitrii TaxID=2650748 RepID=A0A6I4ME41_9ACTN|nr:4Fe-4S cluster-binding domain-containing protein [Actinomadura physcomitrii]
MAGPAPVINVAETCVGTRALGPGLRSVVWVQGCPFQCRGCLAPDWIPFREARRVAPDDLADELLADPDVTGLTLSGGEPMAQAAGLADLVRAARARRELSVLCFTGFRRSELTGRPDAEALLAEVDVLIDGRYVRSRNDDRGLRGSANQRVHHLTDRLAGAAEELAAGPRRAEVRVRGGEALLVGVPPRALSEGFARAREGTVQGREGTALGCEGFTGTVGEGTSGEEPR